MTAAQPAAAAGDRSPDPPAAGSPPQPPAGYTQPTLWDNQPPDPPTTRRPLLAAQGYPRDTSARLARVYTATTTDRPTAADQPQLLASGTGASRSTWRQLFRAAADRAAVAAVALNSHPHLPTRSLDEHTWARASSAAASALGPRVPWVAIRTAHHPGRIVLLLATGRKPAAAQLRAAADVAANTLTAPLRRPSAAFPRPPNRTAANATSPQAAAMPAPQQHNANQPRQR